MKCHGVVAIIFALSFLTVGGSVAQAQWSSEGMAVAAGVGDQRVSDVVADGLGGYIIIWGDDVTGLDRDLYAQHIDASGALLWSGNGAPVCTASGDQLGWSAVADGFGGVIVIWEDNRLSTTAVFAQRLDNTGAPQWTTNGVRVRDSIFEQVQPALMSDGDGGAIITWVDYNGTDNDIYAQHIDLNGGLQWTTHAVPVCTRAGTQDDPCLVTDDAGGALIVWTDEGIHTGYTLVMGQRLDNTGLAQWAIDGVPMLQNGGLGGLRLGGLLADGIGGCWVTWSDNQNPNSRPDIYLGRVRSSGTRYDWGQPGLPICTNSEPQGYPRMAPDGEGGVVLVWEDSRVGTDVTVYGQRVTPDGEILWQYDGLALSPAGSHQFSPRIVADIDGGTILLWNGQGSALFAQRVDDNGALTWGAEGVRLTPLHGNQTYGSLCSDAEGGAVITWTEYRSGTDYDVFVQRISSGGYWGYPGPVSVAVADVPGDQGGQVQITWAASRLDNLPDQVVARYTVWRAIDGVAKHPAPTPRPTVIKSPADVPFSMATDQRVIRLDSAAGRTFYWELVNQVDAYFLPGYASTVATLFDSTSVSPGNHYFQVIAHSSDPAVYWTSPVDSCRSLDNLAPLAPTGLAGIMVTEPLGLQIYWQGGQESDLGDYAVYRSIQPDFVPGPKTLLGRVHQPGYFDVTWTPGSSLTYKITAVDVHENESSPGILVPDAVAPVDRVPVVDRFYPNVPNPFNPVTRLAFDLGHEGFVDLQIFDPRGHLVRTLVRGNLVPGHHSVYWRGNDDREQSVASGVYLARLQTGEQVRVRKLTLSK